MNCIFLRRGYGEVETLPEIGTALDECSWADISKIANAGLASSYWKVGDTKAVTVSGTVGTVSLSGTYYVYIVGFNHNGTTNTIDFGCFKTAASGGKDIALIDSTYNTEQTSGAKRFNMSHWGSSNRGGWKGCDLRYDILGSTDKAPSGYGSLPSTSRVGYDASETCATSPVANTLMSVLPSDLRAVMQPMTIYSDNTGGGTDAASRVTTSIDYLPLMAEFEIFGARTNANSYEKNYQAQYQYYKNGNSPKKYRHTSTNTGSFSITRSVFVSSDYAFVLVGEDGNVTGAPTQYSTGISPIFRVGGEESGGGSGGGTTPKEYAVTLSGTFSSSYGYVTINGTKYTTATTVNVAEGTAVSVYVAGSRTNYDGLANVTLNGTKVQNGKGTYNHTVTSNCAITMSYSQSAYRANITTE